MGATFTRKDVSKLFGVTEGRLQYWDKTDFIVPSEFKRNRRCYSFVDLISVRSALALLENGVSLQKARKMIADLAKRIPDDDGPLLGKLRIASDSNTVLVSMDGRDVEADTGQLILDFTVENLQSDVVAALPERSDPPPERSAYEWYLEACCLDENEDTFADAEFAYHQALQRDPGIATVYTNLGNLRFRQGFPEDARALYMKALEIDEYQPEAQYNLGYLDYEECDFTSAKERFQIAVSQDVSFSDAHYNLAIVMDKLGDTDGARHHLETYLTFDPRGAWAELARRQLEQFR